MSATAGILVEQATLSEETPKFKLTNGYHPRSEAVTDAFIRDAIEKSTVNALRVALYQITKDVELETMKVSKIPVRGGAMEDFVLSAEDEDIVKAKGIDFLTKQENSGGPAPLPPPPSLEEATKLMRMFCGEDEQLSPAMLQLGYEELAFKDFPRAVEWTKKPAQDKISKHHVVIIGAGINGISTAISLQRLGIPYTLVDRQSDVGGTWLQNTYPEARVDTLGFAFQYKFEKGYKWEEMYPSADELRRYLAFVARKHDVVKNFKFDREVIAATWNEESSSWRLTLKLSNGSEEYMETNSIISASGLFATANLPNIAGIRDYKGHMFHTTEWDHGVQYKDKNVAVIGNGSSGAQLIPGLARDAKHLAVYMRTPQWIAPYDGYRSKVPSHMTWLLERMPNYQNWFGFSNFMRGMQLPPLQVEDPKWRAQGGLVNKRNDGMRKGLTEYIKSKVGSDSPLLPKLVPTTAPLVRRLVVDNGFYDALMQDNVELVTETIERVTASGIKTIDGREREFDLIVLGCGFKPTEYLYPVEYKGRNGVTLDKTWEKDGARSYLGLTIPGYPNLFTLYGPNHQPRGGPSLHSWSEIWGRYAVAAIVWMIENDAKSLAVKQSVYDEYNKDLDVAVNKLIWQAEGHGYFVNKHGRQAVNMPWTADQYHPRVIHPNIDDFEVRWSIVDARIFGTNQNRSHSMMV